MFEEEFLIVSNFPKNKKIEKALKFKSSVLVMKTFKKNRQENFMILFKYGLLSY